MKIHVTAVNDCPRKIWYRIRHNDLQLPPHYLSVKGIMSHAAMEMASKGETIDFTYPNLIEHGSRDNSNIDEDIYVKALPEVTRCLNNYNSWNLSDNSKIIEDMIQEETQEMTYGNHVLTGTPDAYNQHLIVDYKTGKPVLRAEYKEQLAAYRWILTQSEKCDDDAKGGVLFLGADEPVYKEVNNYELEKALESFKNKLETHIMYLDEIQADEKFLPICEFGMSCAFCSWRHLCRGI